MSDKNTINTNRYSGLELLTITDYTGGIDVVTSRPGYTDEASVRLMCRASYFPNAGNIVWVDNGGDSDTTTVTAGTTLAHQCASITESGTTITSNTLQY